MMKLVASMIAALALMLPSLAQAEPSSRTVAHLVKITARAQPASMACHFNQALERGVSPR